jgi:hypothetical protein
MEPRVSRCIVTFIADDGSPVTGIDGLVIYMYHREHGPAHFHAEYGEYEITVDIASGIVHGKFLRRALNLVLEWYDQHRGELAGEVDLSAELYSPVFEPLRDLDTFKRFQIACHTVS